MKERLCTCAASIWDWLFTLLHRSEATRNWVTCSNVFLLESSPFFNQFSKANYNSWTQLLS